MPSAAEVDRVAAVSVNWQAKHSPSREATVLAMEQALSASVAALVGQRAYTSGVQSGSK